jgi:hypothetical protein
MKKIAMLSGVAALMAAALVLAPSPSYSAPKSRNPAVSAHSAVAKPVPGKAGQVSRPGKGGIVAPPGKTGASKARVTIQGPWVCPAGGICHCRVGGDRCAPGCLGGMSCERGTCTCTGGLRRTTAR